jgi:5,10-methylenetetrahydromethanopterin reductase
MPPELLARNGIDPDTVGEILAVFQAGNVQQALDVTPPEMGDSLSVAGTPRDWIRAIEERLIPAGFNHLLVTFADPFLVESWSGNQIDGLPSLEEQLRLFHAEVMPAFS